ncbi:metal ABC transporter permease [Polynucleobacter sp. SHI8]|uniref:ABCB family ABC transporter ATP-binding protein/permease n=1 Tax=unclassified Polynucleobacter TaxID=2640945 RepID=UPI002491EAE2|nr:MULTISPECIES: ABC transporter ATP-binding protein/permease [unclassified Polynucleobacter]BDW12100.1 metal ABC transporter permease [Polynucleobacter sp. SHI2]BDW14548.1 metal ABC transporter permease [Polynucleobacter sp. SHI8]
MRPSAADHSPRSSKPRGLGDWGTIKTLIPYLTKYPWRVFFAISCLVLAKVANIGIPVVLKHLIDDLSIAVDDPRRFLVFPLAFVIAYGLLRLSASLFTELREFLFAKVTQNAIRQVAIEVFNHLHSLSLRFHLGRQTGGVSRDIDRGSRGIQSLISYSLYSILPTLIEFTIVLIYLAINYDWLYAAITFCALVIYIIFTVMVTEWRSKYRRKMNEMDTSANQKAIDSLLNFETVKYFSNEKFEAHRYDSFLQSYQKAAVKSQQSLAVLNIGQQSIIVIGLIAILWRATLGVQSGELTLGDIVLINTLMIQMYIPLNFLGVIYREIKQSILDMDNMFSLLNKDQEIKDAPGAPALKLNHPNLGPRVVFDQVNFSYEANRAILKNVSFVIEPGTTTAVVGSSGAGKSTLSRLLFRFYDVQSGAIYFDEQNISAVQQLSLRKIVGIVPQDTVLFNDSIGYNIAYGNPQATQEEIIQAAQAAQIHQFVMGLPEAYKTSVGERGLKLSGGEKQRVAIARTLLKNPALIIFDEATSALDSQTEKAIQEEINKLTTNRTALIIAHRLSTIVHAQQILVMQDGEIVERGTHEELMSLQSKYATMWNLQKNQSEVSV